MTDRITVNLSEGSMTKTVFFYKWIINPRINTAKLEKHQCRGINGYTCSVFLGMSQQNHDFITCIMSMESPDMCKYM